MQINYILSGVVVDGDDCFENNFVYGFEYKEDARVFSEYLDNKKNRFETYYMHIINVKTLRNITKDEIMHAREKCNEYKTYNKMYTQLSHYELIIQKAQRNIQKLTQHIDTKAAMCCIQDELNTINNTTKLIDEIKEKMKSLKYSFTMSVI